MCIPQGMLVADVQAGGGAAITLRSKYLFQLPVCHAGDAGGGVQQGGGAAHAGRGSAAGPRLQQAPPPAGRLLGAMILCAFTFEFGALQCPRAESCRQPLMNLKQWVAEVRDGGAVSLCAVPVFALLQLLTLSIVCNPLAWAS